MLGYLCFEYVKNRMVKNMQSSTHMGTMSVCNSTQQSSVCSFLTSHGSVRVMQDTTERHGQYLLRAWSQTWSPPS